MVDANAIPNEVGVYQLVLSLAEGVTLRVGALGLFYFPAGKYIYTGSAFGGFRARVARHLRREKRQRWHIDYLIQHAAVDEVLLFPTCERKECAINIKMLALPHALVIARGFGSSDCRCPSHLVYLQQDACTLVGMTHRI